MTVTEKEIESALKDVKKMKKSIFSMYDLLTKLEKNFNIYLNQKENKKDEVSKS